VGLAGPSIEARTWSPRLFRFSGAAVFAVSIVSDYIQGGKITPMKKMDAD